MIRAAVIVSGDGPEIQNLLDGNYFHEVPGLEIAGVVATSSESGALLRAKSANVPAYCVDSAIFPNAATFTRALLTKLQDIRRAAGRACGSLAGARRELLPRVLGPLRLPASGTRRRLALCHGHIS